MSNDIKNIQERLSVLESQMLTLTNLSTTFFTHTAELFKTRQQNEIDIFNQIEETKKMLDSRNI